MGVLFDRFSTLLNDKYAGLDQFMTTTIVVHDPVDEHFKKVFKILVSDKTFF